MSSFNRGDYQHLFDLGRELYNTKSSIRRKEIAVELMAMSEMCIGQQVSWPRVEKRYKHLTTYPRSPQNIVYIMSLHGETQCTPSLPQSLLNE